MTILEPITSPTPRPAGRGQDITLAASGVEGSHEVWGDARVVRASDSVRELLPGEILVVDDLTPDLLGFVSICSAVVIGSTGPWEGAIPGALHHDFRRSGAAALLRALGVPCAWGVTDATDATADGDLIALDPSSGSIWAMRTS